MSAAEVTTGAGSSGYGRKGELVLTALRRMIADGEFRPGQHLRQDAIATRLNTSQVPVREVFKILVAEGVIVHRPKQGHYVARLSSGEMRQLCWLRDTAEVELARTAHWPDADVLTRLEGLAAHLYDVARTDGENVVRVAGADHDFHAALWRLSPDTLIVDHAERLWRRIAPYRTFVGYDRDVVERVADEHVRIVAALRAWDRDAFRREILAHQAHTQDTIRRVAEFESSATASP